MRISVLCCLFLLAACSGNPRPARSLVACLAGRPIYTETAEPCAGWEDVARIEHFAAAGPQAFIYGARTNTVMTENDDGTAERIRRQWLAEALRARAMCPLGYVIDSRRFVQQPRGRFANGGDIVYAGRCLNLSPPLPPPVMIRQRERG